MTEEKNSYKGYSLFKDVTDDLLQAWNRASVVANINVDLDAKAAETYVEHFTAVEKMKITMLLAMVSHSGKEEVQKRVMKTVNLED
jgi:hypothetical protein